MNSEKAYELNKNSSMVWILTSFMLTSTNVSVANNPLQKSYDLFVFNVSQTMALKRNFSIIIAVKSLTRMALSISWLLVT